MTGAEQAEEGGVGQLGQGWCQPQLKSPPWGGGSFTVQKHGDQQGCCGGLHLLVHTQGHLSLKPVLGEEEKGWGWWHTRGLWSLPDILLSIQK